MSKKKKLIKYPKERAILSDVLPYEIPITFSNRNFYRFLVDFNVEIKNNNITFDKSLSQNDLGGLEKIVQLVFFEEKTNVTNFKNVISRGIPYLFKISHKENDFRELALIHPVNQLKLIEFYDSFKELILYYCSVSNYSIRKPMDIAKFTFFNDKLHELNRGDKKDFLELQGKEYDNLKTFFSYGKYTNIYRFYEDYRYHRAEKKFKYLFKFDISKCFDSIYSHSIVWSILGIDSVKENINASKKSFGGKFDDFIMNSNYGETNGIIIGPEFSRIFAEIILQKIDVSIEQNILLKRFKNRVDYEMYRYVDDYFLFCDSVELKDLIQDDLKHELKKYKLALNNSKSESYEKPIITNISIAKDKINSLFSENPTFIVEEKLEDNEAGTRGIIDNEDENLTISNYNFRFYFNPNRLITQYKILLKESSVEYKDVLNYTLALLNNILERNLVKFEGTYLEFLSGLKDSKITDKNEIIQLEKVINSFVTHIESFIDFIFFIYSVSPRVNSTIKVCHILSIIIKFFKLKDKRDRKYWINENCRNRVFKKILDECSFVLKINSNEYKQIESTYLLTIIKELGREYRLPKEILEKIIYERCKIEDRLKVKEMDYFLIVVLLFYLGNIEKYMPYKKDLLGYIMLYIQSYPLKKRFKSSEIIHLVLDLLACPFITKGDKEKLVKIYLNEDNFDIDSILRFQKKYVEYWFTNWKNVNLAKELEYKKSQEVYS